MSEHIGLSELPFVMRATGFYPSEEEVGRMETEQLWEMLFMKTTSGNNKYRSREKFSFILTLMNRREGSGCSRCTT